MERSESSFSRVLEVSTSGALAIGAKLTTLFSAASIDATSAIRELDCVFFAIVTIVGGVARTPDKVVAEDQG